MSKTTKFKPVNTTSYLHQQVGSDRYCWEITEVSADGKQAHGYPVNGTGLEGNENPTTNKDAPVTLFTWKYNAWREYYDYNRGNRIITRCREFDTVPHPYLDPSF